MAVLIVLILRAAQADRIRRALRETGSNFRAPSGRIMMLQPVAAEVRIRLAEEAVMGRGEGLAAVAGARVEHDAGASAPLAKLKQRSQSS